MFYIDAVALLLKYRHSVLGKKDLLLFCYLAVQFAAIILPLLCFAKTALNKFFLSCGITLLTCNDNNDLIQSVMNEGSGVFCRQ